jgi:hypothetical protein
MLTENMLFKDLDLVDHTRLVTYIGYKTTEITDINAPLGSNLTVNISVQEESNALKVVIVSTKSNGAFNKVEQELLSNSLTGK